MYASDLKHPSPPLADKLRRLYTLNRDKKIDLFFRPPYLNLLKAFGEPHLNLPPVIHVAGTNGKGSVIAMMRAILEEAGYGVHVYTSPHLVRFNERIVLAGKEIDDIYLEELIDEALEKNNGADITFFEITTAMAFKAFAEVPADILLLEVGLGGRLDCTNIIQNPLASVITSIGIDHTEHLGETLTDIAGEKAGIMKPGAPCISSPQHPEVAQLFQSKAAQIGCPLYFSYESDSDSENKTFPASNLTGAHQKENARTALKTLAIMGQICPEKFSIIPSHIKSGLHKTRWRARLERLTNGPLTKGLSGGAELWLDGGHNESAARALAVQCKTWQAEGKNIHLVLGMMDHKSPAEFLRPLLPFVKTVTYSPIPNEPHALSAKKALAAIKGALKEERSEIKSEVGSASSLASALTKLRKKIKGPSIILMTGSLYLAGHVLTLNAEPDSHRSL